MSRRGKVWLAVALACALAACEGPVGPEGPEGPPGPPGPTYFEIREGNTAGVSPSGARTGGGFAEVFFPNRSLENTVVTCFLWASNDHNRGWVVVGLNTSERGLPIFDACEVIETADGLDVYIYSYWRDIPFLVIAFGVGTGQDPEDSGPTVLFE